MGALGKFVTELSNDSMVPSECISLSWRVGYTETVEDVEVKSYALIGCFETFLRCGSWF